MAVVAESEDAQVERLGRGTSGPGSLVGGRGVSWGELDGPREATGGRDAQSIKHAADGVSEVGVIGSERHATLVAHVPVDAVDGFGREGAGADHPGIESLGRRTTAKAYGSRATGSEVVDPASELREGFLAGQHADRTGGSGDIGHGSEDNGVEYGVSSIEYGCVRLGQHHVLSFFVS